jgi:hypothetical protein
MHNPTTTSLTILKIEKVDNGYNVCYELSYHHTHSRVQYVILKKDLLAFIEDWNLHKIEFPNTKGDDVVQEYLRPESVLENDYERIIKFYLTDKLG